MSDCPECGGVGGYWTEWGNGPYTPELEALLLEPPSAESGGLAYMRCHVCGPMLLRVNALVQLATAHEEVQMALSGVCRRYEVMGVGELAEKYPAEYDLLEQALFNMVGELPHTKGLA